MTSKLKMSLVPVHAPNCPAIGDTCTCGASRPLPDEIKDGIFGALKQMTDKDKLVEQIADIAASGIDTNQQAISASNEIMKLCIESDEAREYWLSKSLVDVYKEEIAAERQRTLDEVKKKANQTSYMSSEHKMRDIKEAYYAGIDDLVNALEGMK